MSEPKWLRKARESGAILTDRGVKMPGESTGKADSVAVPLIPSVNNLFITSRPRRGKRIGRRIRSPQYREWLDKAIPILRGLKPPQSSPFEVVLTLVGGRSLNLGRDVSNIEKAGGDSLVAAGVIPGDSIRDGLWRTIQEYEPGDGPEPFVRVTIRPWQPQRNR